MKLLKISVFLVLLFLFGYNLLSVFVLHDPIFKYRLMTFSPSVGEKYFGRLQIWYYYAQNNHWTQADLVQTSLDPADFSAYKMTHDPSEFKKNVNQLVYKPHKTVEDWVELARINAIIGKNQESLINLSQAVKLDPLRDDLTLLFYRLSLSR